MERGHLYPQSLRSQLSYDVRAAHSCGQGCPRSVKGRLLFRPDSLILARVHWRIESMKLFVVLLIAFAAMSISVSAQKPKPKPCEDAQTQADMNICWGNEYKKADARLNQTYQQLAAMLDDEEKAQLKTAETAWLKYRDTNCEFVADQYKGGSIRPMIAAIC